MKSLFLTAALLATITVSSFAQALASWDFESASPSGTTTQSPTVLPAAATVVGASNAGIQSAPAPNSADASLAAFLFPSAGTGYFQFELLCPSGLCDFTGIEALLYTSAGSPTSVRVEYSTLPSFMSPTVVGTYALNSSGGTVLNLPVNVLGVMRVTGRLYGLNRTNPLGTLYLGAAAINGVVGSAPLPATLVSFDAQSDGDLVYVRWTTASEVEVDAFAVELSYGIGEEFAGIEKVEARGSETAGASYEIVIPARAGTQYLRLRTMDRDGASTLSEVVSVWTPSGKTGWRAALTDFRLQLDSEEAGEFFVVGAQGGVVARGHIGGGETISLDLGHLPDGIYVFHLNGRSERLVSVR